tara:strand:- start:74 stop:637 length:564 start_codon:yes stop_codon:yes gene_type:complete
MNTQNQNLLELLFGTDDLDYTTANVKDFIVKPSNLRVTRDFIEKWHYSKNVNGLTISQIFGLFYEKNLIGAMIYGSLAMANTWKKYAKEESKVVELKRLCCIDKTPKNTESYFIGKTLRWMKQNSAFDLVVSYSDTFYGHEGTIYKASNFKHMGLTTKGKVIDYDGRYYHDKCIRTYYINKGWRKGD